MSSKEIAELTGKRHDNVLRDCDELNERYEDLQLLKIEELFNIRQLPNGGSKKERVYLLTKIQTLDLITGYDASLRIMINRRWEELEKKREKSSVERGKFVISYHNVRFTGRKSSCFERVQRTYSSSFERRFG